MRLAALCLLLLSTAAATAEPADPNEPKAEDTAGMYWLPYSTCDECERPKALVAYVVKTPAAAQQIKKALDGKLALGLPYVVHTDQLGLTPSGIAVVLGSFSSLDAAKAAAAKAPKVGGAIAKATELVLDQYGMPVGKGETPRSVTEVDRGAPVQAWSAADIKQVETAAAFSEDPEAQATIESGYRWMLRELAKKKPACTVRPGDIFLAENKDVKVYEFAPVRCGGKLAYIPWTSSLLGYAVIVNAGGGKFRLRQLVGAQCDSPIIEEWTYDQKGRHRDEKKPSLLAMGGCGG